MHSDFSSMYVIRPVIFADVSDEMGGRCSIHVLLTSVTLP